MRPTPFLLLILAWPAHAQVITPEDFEALSTGKTLYFRDETNGVGAEQYFDNRRVRWMFADGTCTDGYWYAQAGTLCFVYDDAPGPQCWIMTRDEGKISARRAEFNDTSPIVVERIDEKPLACAGPDLGV